MARGGDVRPLPGRPRVGRPELAGVLRQLPPGVRAAALGGGAPGRRGCRADAARRPRRGPRAGVNGRWGPGAAVNGRWGPGAAVEGRWGPGPAVEGRWGRGAAVNGRWGPGAAVEGRRRPDRRQHGGEPLGADGDLC